MNPSTARPHVVIVGGGIAGLAAAFFLRDEKARVTVLEGSPQLGGKLSVSEVAGVAVDEGAEALLVTRPEGIGLIDQVGLAGDRVEPGTTSSAIWTLGALRPLPRRQFMGVPSDLAELARSGVVSAEGAARASSARSDGTPMNWRRGSGRSAPSVQIAEDVVPGSTRSPASPTSSISPIPSGRVTSRASAPSSTATPATSDTDSLPPSRGDPSSTVTRTFTSRRKNAAASPAIPPPTITTCGRAVEGFNGREAW